MFINLFIYNLKQNSTSKYLFIMFQVATEFSGKEQEIWNKKKKLVVLLQYKQYYRLWIGKLILLSYILNNVFSKSESYSSVLRHASKQFLPSVQNDYCMWCKPSLCFHLSMHFRFFFLLLLTLSESILAFNKVVHSKMLHIS